ncbi:LysR family glycine cleavage system transcriptional activator/LysR family D-serine deaminase transcriptional activator [Rhizobium sp. ERR 1071]|uniref:LysR substrate-binding domain-containing protein n=1 Tax=Rhizobium sp. ERR 1071 TaxID=2572677 RepID=UPI001199EFB6|nr:LysR substrate-binding domain-containing protein [Rhizobium sp. ERR1071]TWB07934.1 LysR family glycine cleavage system transcriptional activator/LysR family D-serine deaminase transcriptional activator [Rhizobium sp. ERR1071]
MGWRIPSLNSARCFVVAGEHLSFTKAGAELHITQSAVSRQVQSLEDQLGFPLFARFTRRLELTPQGQILLSHWRTAFLEIEKGVREASSYTDRSIMTVAMPPTFSVRWGTTCIIEFQRLHPATEIRLKVDSEGTSLDAGAVDVAIEFAYARRSRRGARLLFPERLIPICSPAYAAELSRSKPEQMLRSATLLHVQQWTDRYGDWKNWLAAAGYPNVPFERGLVFETADLVLRAAKQGAGIGIGDHAYIRDDLAAGVLVAPFPVTVGYDRAYFISAREDDHDLDVRSAFVDFMIHKTMHFNEA